MAFAFFGFAALVGLALVALSKAWIMIPLGVLAILAAWRYTGGDHPYGYRGPRRALRVRVLRADGHPGHPLHPARRGHLASASLGAVGVGAIASAILVANNLRDIPTDRASGKLTLAVRLGDRGTRILYAALVAVAALAVVGIALTYLPALIALVAFALAWRPVRLVAVGRHRPRPRGRAGSDRALRDRVCRPARRRAGLGRLARLSRSAVLDGPLAVGSVSARGALGAAGPPVGVPGSRGALGPLVLGVLGQLVGAPCCAAAWPGARASRRWASSPAVVLAERRSAKYEMAMESRAAPRTSSRSSWSGRAGRAARAGRQQPKKTAGGGRCSGACAIRAPSRSAGRRRTR